MTTVYLSGPMTGLSLEEMRKWRRSAAALLSQYDNFKVLDPTDNGFDETLTDRQIVARNKYMIIQSDIILANLSSFSVGTIGEIIWAATVRPTIPIVVFGNYGVGSRYHPWIKEHITAKFVMMRTAVEFIVDQYGFRRGGVCIQGGNGCDEVGEQTILKFEE